MPDRPTLQTQSDPPIGQPASIRPGLVVLLLGAVWGLVILLTVKSFVPYGGATTLAPAAGEVQFDEATIEAIQARVTPGGTKEGL